VHGSRQAVAVTDVTDEEAQARVVAEHLADLVLLQLVAGEHHDPGGVQVVQGVAEERLAERPGGSGHEDRRSTQNAHEIYSWGCPCGRLGWEA
jgi:hypothetical protein